MQFDSPVILGNPSEAVSARGDIAGAVEVNLEQSSYITATVTGAVNWSFVGDAALRGVLIKLTNAGAHEHTFPANVKFSEGTKPTFTAAGVDFLSVFSDDGVTFYASLAVKDAK